MSGFSILFLQPWKQKYHPHKMWMNRPEADSHLSPAGSPLWAAPHRQNTNRFLSSVYSTSVTTVQSGCQSCWVAGQSLCAFRDGLGCLGLVYCQCAHLTALKLWLLAAVLLVSLKCEGWWDELLEIQAFLISFAVPVENDGSSGKYSVITGQLSSLSSTFVHLYPFMCFISHCEASAGI